MAPFKMKGITPLKELNIPGSKGGKYQSGYVNRGFGEGKNRFEYPEPPHTTKVTLPTVKSGKYSK